MLWHQGIKKAAGALLYQNFSMPTSNLERPLEGRALRVVLRVYLEAMLNFQIVVRDIIDYSGFFLLLLSEHCMLLQEVKF
jgi:hypothetical protein